MTLIKEFKVPTQVHSASLKPDQSIFVCGGEDFKIYKYDYATGEELGKYDLVKNILFGIILATNC